jgi:fructose-1,6-bisphosphatase I
MSEKKDNIKLSKWLENELPQSFLDRDELIEIIETIAESTIPIRGLLERGITSREIEHRMEIEKVENQSINLYGESQIHEDLLTHSIILKALQESDVNFLFIASEEAEPVLGSGKFGITIDPVDGSSNVIVNRTVGTIVGIYNEMGLIICSFYVLYGIYTNLVLALNGKVAEFILDTSPYSMTFYHYIYQELKELPNSADGGIRCLGGNSTKWTNKCKAYEQALINRSFKDRYSGSFVGDLHAIITYGGVYSYFPSPKAKIRTYYEWLPLAFIIITLKGVFLIIGTPDNSDDVKTMEYIEPLTVDNVKKIHTSTSGGLLGSEKPVNLFISTN